MKLRILFNEIKYKNYPELNADLTDIFKNFGGPAGRGQGQTFTNHAAFERLSQNIPFKNPKIIYRGLSLESNLQVNEELINKIKSGIRSYTKFKSIGVKYTWSGIYNPTRILLVVENPICICSGDAINSVSKVILGMNVLDDGEFIFDAKSKSVTNIEKIEDKKGFHLYVVTLN